MKKLITTASLITLMAVPAIAADTATAPSPMPAEKQDQATAKTQTMAEAGYTDQISAKELLNKNVRNGTSDVVGDINDIRFDATGKISAVIVGVGGFLGLGEKDVALPYERVTFARDDDGGLVVTADVTKESLQAMPEWKSPEKNS